jgi:DNA-binding NtrC family response regulator
LRRHDAKAKVIVVTGYPSVESIVIAMQNGAWDYVQKPVDVQLLLKKISSALAVADS